MIDTLKLSVEVLPEEEQQPGDETYIRFTPNELLIRGVQPDLVRKKMLVYYELRNNELSSVGYITRNQVETGSVEIDIDTLLMAIDNSNPEVPEMNEYITNLVLQNFKLKLKTTMLLPL